MIKDTKIHQAAQYFVYRFGGDTNIHQVARKFVYRFGKDAPVEARQRANELQQAGNAEGHDTWTHIYEQVKRLVEDGNEAPED